MCLLLIARVLPVKKKKKLLFKKACVTTFLLLPTPTLDVLLSPLLLPPSAYPLS